MGSFTFKGRHIVVDYRILDFSEHFFAEDLTRQIKSHFEDGRLAKILFAKNPQISACRDLWGRLQRTPAQLKFQV